MLGRGCNEYSFQGILRFGIFTEQRYLCPLMLYNTTITGRVAHGVTYAKMVIYYNEDNKMFKDALDSICIDIAKHDLATQGFYQVPGHLAISDGKDAIAEINRACNERNDLDINYGGSEHRIWHANEYLDTAEAFRMFSNAIIPKLEGAAQPAKNILAIRNKPLNKENMALRKGRWHLDSFKRQYKVFVFLQDVNENDGPFELIPRTQQTFVKVKHALPGHYFHMRDFFLRNGKRGYQNVSDSFIEDVKKTYPSQIFTVQAGAIVIADTSALHRAHPVRGGERYALTSYH